MIDYEYSSLFLQDGVKKAWTITCSNGVVFTNENLENGSITIHEQICSETNLTFGLCEPSSIEFVVRNNQSSLIGETITVKLVLNNHTESPLIIGTYKVDSDKPDGTRKYRRVHAYDALYEANGKNVAEWYESITHEEWEDMTLKSFRDSLFNHLGIDQEDVVLPNDDMTVEKTIDLGIIEDPDDGTVSIANELLANTVLMAICEINGCFGHIGRDGKFHYIFLNIINRGVFPSETLYPDDENYPKDDNVDEKIELGNYISCEYEDYDCQEISKLQIRQDQDDVGVIVGDGENCYIIEDNFLVYGKNNEELEEVANNIFELMDVTSYRPVNLVMLGNPCTEVGDLVRVECKDALVYSYIMSRTLTGVSNIRDELESTGEEKRPESIDMTNTAITQLRGKTNRLRRTVDELVSEIENIEGTYAQKTYVQQTAEAITGGSTETISSVYDLANAAEATAQTAEALAGSKSVNTVSDNPTPPSNAKVGDTWYYTGQSIQGSWQQGTLYYYSGAALGWVRLVDKQMDAKFSIMSDEILASVSSTYELKNAKNATFNQNTIPTANKVGDLWYCTADNGSYKQGTMYIWTGNAWSTVDNTYVRSQIKIQTDAISATVEQKLSATGGNSSSFGWNLTASGFTLNSNGSAVFKCDSTGVEITGKIVSTTGNIGPWQISASSINNGIAFTNQKNNKSTGMGTYGGNWAFWAGNGRFSVDQDGNLYCSNATIGGYATDGQVVSVDNKVNTVSGQLTAVSARVGTIEANYVNTAQLTAVDAKVTGKLSASTFETFLADGTVGGVRLYANTVYATAYQFGSGTAMTSEWASSRATSGWYAVHASQSLSSQVTGYVYIN